MIEREPLDIEEYDLFSPDFKANPFPTYARMRANSPVYAHVAPNGSTIWYITRYADVLAILRDDEHYCKDPRNTGDPSIKGSASRKSAMHRLINENMLFSDPPNHTRLRAIVSQVFTPQRVAQLAGFIQQTADRLIDQFHDNGEVDLISAYALPLPVFVICQLLGVPEEDRDDVAMWSQAIISPGSRDLTYRARKQRVQALIRYLDHMFSIRSEEPQDDLISALVHAEEAGDRLSEAELSSMVALLLVTGHETTVNLIGNGTLSLLQHFDQLIQLRDNPTLWDSAIEELLRFNGPVETSTSRWARKEFSLNGHLIKRGDLIRVVLSSANRDAEQFELADELHIARSENKHLAFGYGVHYCVGAPLARLEGKIALQTLFDRLDNLHLRPADDQPQWRTGVLLRGLKELNVCWDQKRGATIF